MCHTMCECREIKKLTQQFHKKQQQAHKEGAPSRQWEGKQKMDLEEEKDEEIAFQNAKKEMMVIYGHSDSETSDN
jgi:hypothetical protein